MKISFVEPHLKIFGGIRRIIELSNGLVKRGHDVTIYHSDGSPCQWLECIAKIKSYDNFLKDDHIVIIYNDPNPTDYNLVKIAKAKLKIFYVLELYKKELLTSFHYKMYRSKHKRMLVLKRSLRSPYLKLCNSTWQADWLKKNMNIDSEILFGGVNTEIFYPVTVKKNEDRIRLLCSGDKRKRKGTTTILEAVEMARKHEPRLVLDTYSGSGLRQDEMAQKYSSADLFLEASWHAGWNNPVAEAMACKVPVICTDIGGVKDFAFNEKTALLVPARDPHAMASAILRLIEDKHLRERIRKNAYQHIKHFEWNKSVKRLEEIIDYNLPNQVNGKSNIIKTLYKSVRKPTKTAKRLKLRYKKAIYGRNYFAKYDKLGAYHWDIYDSDAVYRDHVNYIIANFQHKSKGTLIDLGCGDGFITSMLADIGFEVTGVDTIKSAVTMARKRCSNAIFEVRNIFQVNERFDYLLASEVIEHIENPEGFLQKICNLFAIEALITTPKRDYYRRIDPYHFREYTVYEFENLIEKYFKKFRINHNEKHLYAWIKK